MENAWSSQALVALGYCLFFCSLFVGFNHLFLTGSFARRWQVDPGTAADMSCKCVSALFGLLSTAVGMFMFATSISRSADEENPIMDRIVERYLVFAMSYFLYDLYAMYRVFCHKTELLKRDHVSIRIFLEANPLIAAHHLSIALFFVPLMWNCRDHEPGNLMLAVALMMEASTPFVSLRSILSDLGMKKSTLYLVNGLLMVAVFLCCRILSYLAFYVAYGAMRNMSVLEAMATTPNRCIVFVILTILPQLHWFSIMLKGAIKVIKEHFAKEELEQVKKTT